RYVRELDVELGGVHRRLRFLDRRLGLPHVRLADVRLLLRDGVAREQVRGAREVLPRQREPGFRQLDVRLGTVQRGLIGARGGQKCPPRDGRIILRGRHVFARERPGSSSSLTAVTSVVDVAQEAYRRACFTKVPCSYSRKATRNSACVFITTGPCQATGSSS